jgi:tRNA threonylcarbamoyladenosine biosynthesis protein TsaB
MAYILHLDTTTKKCSVALAFNGILCAQKELLSEAFSHSEKLHVFIQEVLTQGGIEPSQLQAIAVSKGPGSYTGLRIGIAAAKGLCFAMDIPLIALNTLEIMVQPHIVSSDTFIIPMLDARRMEVYTAVFDSNKKWVTKTSALVLSENSFMDVVKTHPCLIIGDGATKFKSLHPKIKAHFTEEVYYPSAKEMFLLALKRFEKKEFESLAYFEPFYLKDFQTTPSKK